MSLGVVVRKKIALENSLRFSPWEEEEEEEEEEEKEEMQEEEMEGGTCTSSKGQFNKS